jgi:thiol-disulfide isomerase/thioredoxin
VKAQPEQISWRLAAIPARLAPGAKFEAQLKAQIGAGWHIYSISQPEGGPTPTVIKVENEQAFKMMGVAAGPKPEILFDQNFNMKTEFYRGEVDFTLPLEVSMNASPTDTQNLIVKVTYQLCNDELCLPPKTLTLQTPIMIAKAIAPTSSQTSEHLNFHPTTNALSVKWSEQGIAVTGAPVPDFTFVDFSGRSRKFSEFRGKYVLLDFWATWCKPCLADLPHLKELYAKYQTRGFEIIGMDSETLGQTDEDVDAEFAKEAQQRAKMIVSTRGASWTHATSASAVPIAQKVFGVGSLPTKILVDPQGKVIAQVKEGAELDALLEKLLTDKEASENR